MSRWPDFAKERAMPSHPLFQIESDKAERRRYRLSITSIVSSLALVVLSWSLFLWLSYQLVIIVVLPLMAIIALLSALAVRLLNWMMYRPWCIELNRRGLTAFVIILLIGILSAPTYGYAYGNWIAQEFIQRLDIRATERSRKIVLVTSFFHYYSEPHRGVTSTYALHEPVSEVKAGLRSRLKSERGWMIMGPGGILIDDETLHAFCDLNIRSDVFVHLELHDSGFLEISIDFAAPNYCFLR